MSQRLIQALETALESKVQQVARDASLLIQFSAGHFQEVLEALKEAKDGAPAPAKVAAQPDVSAMVDRFLAWELPADFAPDGGISYTPIDHPNAKPVGTNLFTAIQAKAMLEHVLSTDTGGE